MTAVAARTLLRRVETVFTQEYLALYLSMASISHDVYTTTASKFIKENLVYLPLYSVLVCRPCGHAVQGSHLLNHLLEKHKLPRQVRQAIVAEVKCQFTRIRWSDGEARQVQQLLQLPVNQAIPAIPFLRIYKDGYQCTTNKSTTETCFFVSRDKQGIQKHCKKEHGWINPVSRGKCRDARRQIEEGILVLPYVNGVFCQHLFATSLTRFYFPVLPDAVESPTTTNDNDGRDNSLSEPKGVLDQVEQQLAQRLEMMTNGSPQFRDRTTDRYPIQPTPWLEVTRWIPFLHGHDLRGAAKLAALPLTS